VNYALILKGILAAVHSFANYLNNKQLIDGAVAKTVLEGLEHANKAIADTRAAQSDAGVRESTRKKYTVD
jgi:hypothetical protein